MKKIFLHLYNTLIKIWSSIKEEENNRALILITTLIGVIAAIIFGQQQVSINNSLKKLESTPILSIYLDNFKYASSTGSFNPLIHLQNEGKIAITNIKYNIQISKGFVILESPNTEKDIIFPNQGLDFGLRVGYTQLPPRPSTEVKLRVNYTDIYSEQKNCVEREYIYTSKDESLIGQSGFKNCS